MILEQLVYNQINNYGKMNNNGVGIDIKSFPLIFSSCYEPEDEKPIYVEKMKDVVDRELIWNKFEERSFNKESRLMTQHTISAYSLKKEFVNRELIFSAEIKINNESYTLKFIWSEIHFEQFTGFTDNFLDNYRPFIGVDLSKYEFNTNSSIVDIYLDDEEVSCYYNNLSTYMNSGCVNCHFTLNLYDDSRGIPKENGTQITFVCFNDDVNSQNDINS